MPDRGFPKPHWLLYGSLAGIWLLAGLYATSLGSTAGRIFSNIGYVILPLVGALVATRRALLVQGVQRKGWFVFTGSFVCWSLAGIVWTYYELVRGEAPAFPGLSDAGFILYTLLATTSLFLLSTRWAPRPRGVEVLDLAILAVAVSYTTYHFVHRGALTGFADDPLGVSVLLAYPASDACAVAMTLFTLTRAAPGRRAQPALIGSGLFLLAVINAAWIYMTEAGTYVSGTPFDLLYHLSFMLVIFGIVYRQVSPDEVALDAKTPIRYAMPVILGGLIGMLAVIEAREGEFGVAEAGFLLSLLFALAVRQAFAMRNNDQLRTLAQTRADQLQAANARLAAAAEEKAQFVNATAHELSNPLTPMAIQTKLLLNPDHGRDDAKRQRSVDHIQRAIERLRNLVEDLLSIGRMESGKFAVKAQECDLAVLVREATQFFEDAAKKEGLALQVETSPSAPVQTDPSRVHQILANFISNAIKYSPPGGTVHVRLRSANDGNRIEVSDAGPGLTPEQRDLLFRPFSQVQGANVQKKGTGLGLYICMMLAKRLGGQIGCDSPGPGQGTCFWLELPHKMESSASTSH